MLKKFEDIQSDVVEQADVVVIGTGAGGAPMAAELARAGLDVVILEEGGYYTTEDYTHNVAEMLKKLYRNAGATLIFGKPSIAFAEGRAVGGSTVINGGMCWRTPEKVLRKWEWESGLSHISAKDMEPWFDYVEERANIRPQDPESLGIDNNLHAAGADSLGWRVSQNRRNQKHCAGANLCTQGCPTGAKQSTLFSFLPIAHEYGARLYANCRAERILTKNGKAVGVEAYFVDAFNKKYHRMTVHAKVVVSACGASETPALFLRSKIKARSGLLGRNLQVHPNTKVVGIFDQDVSSWKGVHQSHQVHEFIDEGIILATAGVPPGLVALATAEYGADSADFMQQFNHMLLNGCLIEDTSRGKVTLGMGGAPIMKYNLNDHDFYLLKRGTALAAELNFAAGAKKVVLPFAQLPEIHSADEIHKIFDYKIEKRDTEVLTVHIMGTMQMGANPQKSVVDNWGEMHDVENLFVSDASLFPSPIGVNPQETIMALAVRSANHIANNKARYLG